MSYIIGIDPGTACGWAVLNASGATMKRIDELLAMAGVPGAEQMEMGHG